MEIGDECWDQVTPLLMNEGPIINSTSSGQSYTCSPEEVSFLAFLL